MTQPVEILNLEELLPERPRAIQLKDCSYLVPEPTLAQDLSVRALINKIEAKREAGEIDAEEAFFTTMSEIVKVRAPELPADEIEKMSLPRLTAVFRFVQGASLEQVRADMARVEKEVQEAVAASEGDEKN